MLCTVDDCVFVALCWSGAMEVARRRLQIRDGCLDESAEITTRATTCWNHCSVLLYIAASWRRPLILVDELPRFQGACR